jgi:hypothetical protein
VFAVYDPKTGNVIACLPLNLPMLLALAAGVDTLTLGTTVIAFMQMGGLYP